MGQTLTNGIYLPDEGEVRCYDGLASNWTTLDAVVGGYRAHVANENIHITSEERNKWDTGVTQAYVLRYASVSLTALGTVAFSALDNTDNVKIGDKVLDSEGKLFALTAVDTENNAATLSALLIDLSKDSDLSNYYTKPETDTLLNDKADASALTAHTGNTTIHVTAEDKSKWNAVTTKANDADVLHKSGDEIAAGIKTFSDVQIISYGTQYKGARNAYILPEFSAGYSGLSITTLSFAQTVKIGTFVLDANNKPSLDTTKAYIQCATGENNSVNSCILEPRNSASSSLGTSSNKWNMINGISTGALGLPNYALRADISGYILDIAGGNNTYTPPADGFVFVRSDNATYLSIMDIPSGVCQVSKAGTAGTIGLYFPVLKGRGLYIKIVCTSLNIAYFIPSQGNA